MEQNLKTTSSVAQSSIRPQPVPRCSMACQPALEDSSALTAGTRSSATPRP